MKRTLFTTLLTTFLAALLSLSTIGGASYAAEEKEQPKLLSADELLKQVQSGIIRDRAEISKLVADFNKDKSKQAGLLRAAKAERNRLEAQSKSLETSFNKNKDELAELLKTLNKRLGSLKELFGVFVQITGSASGIFQNAITQVQYPERVKFLRDFNTKISQGNRLPSIEDVEKLWFVLHQEMTNSGKVETFTTTVVNVSGSEEEMEVLRVGLFNMFADGEYLRYLPENGRLAQLTRQPSQADTGFGADVQEDDSGELLPFSLDPTRGTLIAALIETPSYREQIEYGGYVGYFIMILLVLISIVTFVRARKLNTIQRSIDKQLKDINTPTDNNPLGRMMLMYEKNKHLDPESLELKLDEVLVKEIPGLQKGLGFVKLCTVVSPLCGLLGTVAGMILTFQAITLYGSGDPKIMAAGISQALINTIQGLSTAIPGMFMSAYLTSRITNISQILEQQTAGMIAAQAEVE